MGRAVGGGKGTWGSGEDVCHAEAAAERLWGWMGEERGKVSCNQRLEGFRLGSWGGGSEYVGRTRRSGSSGRGGQAREVQTSCGR